MRQVNAPETPGPAIQNPIKMEMRPSDGNLSANKIKSRLPYTAMHLSLPENIFSGALNANFRQLD